MVVMDGPVMIGYIFFTNGTPFTNYNQCVDKQETTTFNENETMEKCLNLAQSPPPSRLEVRIECNQQIHDLHTFQNCECT